MLNGPETLQEAKRKLKAQVRMVHPDKIDALYRMSGKPLPKPFPATSRDTMEFLALIRKVLDHPIVGPALFCQERAGYGQWGSGFVAVIGCILSLVAAAVNWAKHGRLMHQVRLVLSSQAPSPSQQRLLPGG
ncbi:MAG: hypothetical protein EOO38_32615 [Cytophagaceae bacterium]|nr:MAG: hypothetical protein EOO38_32615 [Cytophagaceae bacterium]